MDWRHSPFSAGSMAPGLLALILGLAPMMAQADGLMGRTVLFRAETWDDPQIPLLRSSDYVGKVGEGPEFGMVREVNDFLGVVPVVIDVAEGRIDFTYPGQSPSQFHVAAFNGYVLTFPTECVLIGGARIDAGATTLDIDDSALTLSPTSLMLNVSGQHFDATTTIGVIVDVGDCPIS